MVVVVMVVDEVVTDETTLELVLLEVVDDVADDVVVGVPEKGGQERTKVVKDGWKGALTRVLSTTRTYQGHVFIDLPSRPLRTWGALRLVLSRRAISMGITLES